MTDHFVGLSLADRWIGWTSEEWEVAQKWAKGWSPLWAPASLELRRVWLKFHPDLSRPILPPRYDIELWNKSGTVDRVQVREYDLSTAGIKYRDMVTGDYVAYPLDTFREVRVRDMKEKRA